MSEKAETVVKPEDQEVGKKKTETSTILLFALYGLTILLIVLVLISNWNA
ncbi:MULTISPECIES: hypothetical protein [unclassified Dehalobacter]|nr:MULTISPECIES: hypothetical protein [unclassified Dehalobacter]